MSEITLVRQHEEQFTEEEKATVRRFLFSHIDGLGERGRRQWRRFWGRLFKLEPGEMVEIKTNQVRLGWYQRKHMAMEQACFNAQDRVEQFEHFRNWLKVGAAHCTWYPGPKGGVIAVPDSTSYSAMEQGKFEQFHHDAVEFLRTEQAGRTLWKHLTPERRIEMIETILAGFNE